MKTVVYIVTCVVVLSVVSCTSRQKGGDDVQVLMQDSTVTSAPQRMQVSDTKVTITYKGLVYDKTTPQGIMYAASICYPQTDLYVPLRLTVSADGKISMAKEELLEDVYEEDTVSN